MRSFITWLHGIALTLGGPGLFAVAFLDSSFISLPQINDILVVLMVIEHKDRMPYYALMATAGSVAGCLAIGVAMYVIVGREHTLPATAGRLFLVVGLLGGMTTFSTFGYETLVLLLVPSDRVVKQAEGRGERRARHDSSTGISSGRSGQTSVSFLKMPSSFTCALSNLIASPTGSYSLMTIT